MSGAEQQTDTLTGLRLDNSKLSTPKTSGSKTPKKLRFDISLYGSFEDYTVNNDRVRSTLDGKPPPVTTR